MLDRQTTFSNAQAITGAAGTTVSTDKIDIRGGPLLNGFITDTLGNTVGNDPGKSPRVAIDIVVTEAFAGGDSVQFQIGYDDSAAFGSPTILATTEAIVIATLVPGYRVRLAMAPGQAAADIYMGVQYKTLGAGAMTAGKVTAQLVQRGGIPTAPGIFV